MNLFQNLLKTKPNPIDNFVFDALALLDDKENIKILEIGAPKNWSTKGRNNGDFSTFAWLENNQVESVLVIEPNQTLADKAAKNMSDLNKVNVFCSNPATFVKFCDQSFDIAYIKHWGGTKEELSEFKNSLGYHAEKIVVDPSVFPDVPSHINLPAREVQNAVLNAEDMQVFEQEYMCRPWSEDDKLKAGYVAIDPDFNQKEEEEKR